MCKTIDLCIRKWVNQLIANEPTCQQHIRVIIHATKTMKLQSKIQVKAVKVADFAKKSNNSAASCKFGVNRKLVRDWWKQSDKIKILNTKCAVDQITAGLNSKNMLSKWVDDSREQTFKLCHCNCCDIYI